MLDSSRADSRESLPEPAVNAGSVTLRGGRELRSDIPNGMIIPSCHKNSVSPRFNIVITRHLVEQSATRHLNEGNKKREGTLPVQRITDIL